MSITRPRPRLSIPSHGPRKKTDLDVSFNLVPGNLSPDLQPSSPPPKFPEKYSPQNVSKIGRYLLLGQLEGESYKAVNWQNNEEYICKVWILYYNSIWCIYFFSFLIHIHISRCFMKKIPENQNVYQKEVSRNISCTCTFVSMCGLCLCNSVCAELLPFDKIFGISPVEKNSNLTSLENETEIFEYFKLIHIY